MSDTAIGPRSLAHGLNLIWALAWRNFTPRSRREGSKLAWVFLEPIGTTIVIAVIYTLIGRGTPYGPSLALFIMTGIVMLSFFSQGANLVVSGITGLSSPGRLATIGLFHEAIAKIVFKFIVTIAYFIVLFEVIVIYEGINLRIHDPYTLIHAFAAVSLLTFGWGLLMGFFTIFAPTVTKTYGIVARGQIFITGVFFVPSFMPPIFRDIIVWNPLLHVVELLRLGLYANYPTIVYDPAFLHGTGLGFTALGMAMIWRQRTRLLG